MVGLAWAPSGAGNQELDPMIEVYGPRAFSGVRFLSACFMLVDMFLLQKQLGQRTFQLSVVFTIWIHKGSFAGYRLESSQLATY